MKPKLDWAIARARFIVGVPLPTIAATYGVRLAKLEKTARAQHWTLARAEFLILSAYEKCELERD